MKKSILIFAIIFLIFQLSDVLAFGVVDENGNILSYEEYQNQLNKNYENKKISIDLSTYNSNIEKIKYLMEFNNLSIDNFNVGKFKTNIERVIIDNHGNYHALLNYSYNGIDFDVKYIIHFYANGELIGLFEKKYTSGVRTFIYPKGYEKSFRTARLNNNSVIYFDETSLINKPKIQISQVKDTFLKKSELYFTSFDKYNIQLYYWDNQINLSNVRLVWIVENKENSEEMVLDATTGEIYSYFDGIYYDGFSGTATKKSFIAKLIKSILSFI